MHSSCPLDGRRKFLPARLRVTAFFLLLSHSAVLIARAPFLPFPCATQTAICQRPPTPESCHVAPLKRLLWLRSNVCPVTCHSTDVSHIGTREAHMVLLTWKHTATCARWTLHAEMQCREQGRRGTQARVARRHSHCSAGVVGRRTMTPAVWSDWSHKESVTGPRPASPLSGHVARAGSVSLWMRYWTDEADI